MSKLLINAIPKEKPWFKKAEIIIAVISLIVSILSMAVSIILGILAMNQATTLSKQDQTIKNFGELLDGVNRQISVATSTDSAVKEQLVVLGKQLEINNDIQVKTNYNAQLNYKSAVNRLFATNFELDRLLSDFVIPDSTIMTSKVNKVISLMESEFNNPYLLQNDSILQNWFSTYRNFRWYNYIPSNENHNLQEYERIKINYDEYAFCKKKLSETVHIINAYVRKSNPTLTFSTYTQSKKRK